MAGCPPPLQGGTVAGALVLRRAQARLPTPPWWAVARMSAARVLAAGPPEQWSATWRGTPGPGFHPG